VFLDPIHELLEPTEMPGYFVGFVNNVGYGVAFKTLENELNTVLQKSVVQSSADPSHQNK
jgi:hypothetical protein